MNRRKFLGQAGLVVVTAAMTPTIASRLFANFARAADIDSAALEALRQGLSDGKILLPGSNSASDASGGGGYKAHATIYQARISSNPRIIVACTSAEEVAHCVKWAKSVPIPLHLKSGGHSYEGLSTGPNLLLDLSPMNEIANIDVSNKRATIETGARLGKVYQILAEKGLVLPAGSCPQVGVGGLTQGGGHGLLSRKFGLTCDHLIGADVVTADGEILYIDPDNHHDLFWAIRGGGGGSFCVVTRFHFKLQSVPKVMRFQITWPNSKGFEAFDAWQSIAPSADDGLATMMHVTAQKGALINIHCTGQYAINPNLSLDDALAPLLAACPGGTVTSKSLEFIDAVKYFAGGSFDADTQPIYFKASSDYVFEAKKLTREGFDTLVQNLGAGSMTGTALCDAYGGAINRVPTSETAFPHRVGALYCIQYYAEWGLPSSITPGTDAAKTFNAAKVGWMKNVRTAMRPYVSGQNYSNYSDLDIPDALNAYYSTNLPRLSRVKQKYDGGGNGKAPMFTHAQSIPPSSDLFSPLQLISPVKSIFDAPGSAPGTGKPIRTRFWLEGDTLIARFEVKNPNPYLRTGAADTKAPTPELYNFEVVELFLSVTGMPQGDLGSGNERNTYGTRDEVFPYYEFEVSPRNEFLEVKILSPKKATGDARFDEKFRSGFVHYATQKADGWAAEMHIPLKALGWDGDPAKLVGNAFGILGAKPNRAYYSLFLPKTSKVDFHRPRYFERLITE